MKNLCRIGCFVLVILPVMVSAQTPNYSNANLVSKQHPDYPNVFTFSVENEPELAQIAGAPKAHYSYFWEFGDGEFSTDANPQHVYTDSTGKEKKVIVSLTNNYGSGGAPRLRPKKVKPIFEGPVSKNVLKKESMLPSPIEGKTGIHVMTNHSPRPGDPMVCVVSYENIAASLPESGQIYLFFNEKAFGYNSFSFEESRVHHGEIFSEGMPGEMISFQSQTAKTEELWASSAVKPSIDLTGKIPRPEFIEANELTKNVSGIKKQFNNVLSWHYSGLKSGEKRNIFTTLNCSSDMKLDTTKTITIRAVVVPERGEKSREYQLKMVIQSSHDPNKLSVSDRRIKKRHIKRNGITYKIQFQNVGRGAAQNIRLETPLHPSLDPSTITLVDYYPRADFCNKLDTTSKSCLDSLSTSQKVVWNFSNIYLPGTRQDDREDKRKATKGWLEFTVKPKKGFHRKDLIDARTHIYFDKNEPVRTNRVRTIVEKNWAYGLKGGFTQMPFDSDYMMVGLTFGSFRPRSIYLQPEIMMSSVSHKGVTLQINEGQITGPDGNTYQGDQTTDQSFDLLYLDVVPLQLRTNITPFASIGVGLQFSWLLKSTEVFNITRTFEPISIRNGFEPPFPPYTERTSEVIYNRFDAAKNDERFSGTELGYFVDIQGGLVNKGPSIGLRYLSRSGTRPTEESRAGVKQNNGELQVYLQLRF